MVLEHLSFTKLLRVSKQFALNAKYVLFIRFPFQCYYKLMGLYMLGLIIETRFSFGRLAPRLSGLLLASGRFGNTGITT